MAKIRIFSVGNSARCCYHICGGNVMGRPKLGEGGSVVFSLTLSAAMHSALASKAAASGVSMAEIIRRVLEEELCCEK